MAVDSYAYLPRSFVPLYSAIPMQADEPVWAEPAKAVGESTFGLLSSAGFFLPSSQDPFDVEREKSEPTWGDPTLRVIPGAVTQDEIDAVHLHINTDDLLADMNVALPIRALTALEQQDHIGGVAAEHYSVMGYQEHGAEVWRHHIGPEIAARCRDAEIDVLVLAPA